MKNPFCEFYSECLNGAAARDIKTWSCAGCPYENEKRPIQITRSELTGCLALLISIFNPKLKRPNLGAVDGYLEDFFRKGMPVRKRNGHKLKDPAYF